MTLDDLIITLFCVIDDGLIAVRARDPWRTRGPHPTLSDSEVLTMEVVGEYLGLEQDSAIFADFRQHSAAWFPALTQVHRTTLVRQAANLHRVKERLWQWVVPQIPHDPHLALVDSLAVPVCQLARATRCRRLAGMAAFGYDHLTRQTFYGVRFQARICWPGVITQFELAPGTIHETEAVYDLTPGTTGLLIGDRNYWSPRTWHLTT